MGSEDRNFAVGRGGDVRKVPRRLSILFSTALAVALGGLFPVAAAAETEPPPREIIGFYPDQPDARTTYLAIFRTDYPGPHRLEVTQGCAEGEAIFSGEVLPENGLLYFPVGPRGAQASTLPCPEIWNDYTVFAIQPDGSEVLVASVTSNIPRLGDGPRVIPFIERSREAELAGRARYLPIGEEGISRRARITMAAAGLEGERRYFVRATLRGNGAAPGRCKQGGAENTVSERSTEYGWIGAFADFPSRLSLTGEEPYRRWCSGREYRLQLKPPGNAPTAANAIVRIR